MEETEKDLYGKVYQKSTKWGDASTAWRFDSESAGTEWRDEEKER